MKVLAPTVLLSSLCASAHAQISNLACVAEGMQLVETVACVRVADFNGDGIQDVAILRNGSIDHVEVGLRDATGALPVVSPGAYPMILGSPPSRRGGTTNSTVEGLMAVGQLSGSPLPDVLVATQSGFLYLFENLGSPGVRAGWGGGLASSLGLFDEIHDLALSDVNGDGLLDIVVLWAPPSSTNQPNQVKILYNSAGGFSAANSGSIPLWVGTGQGVPSSIAMWDANRDGIPEAILGGIKDGSSSSYGTGWQINRNPVTGQTTFSALPWTIPLNADTPFHTVVADFDQDGWDDVAFGCFFSSTVRRTLHVQRLTFGSQLTPAGAVQSFFGDPIRCLVASDIDLDGDPDLLITTPRSLPASDLVGFVNTGGGAFSINLVNIPTNRSSVLLEMSDAIAITAAEISVVADGKPDVVIGNDIQAPSNRRAIRLLENQNLLPWSAYGTGCTGSNGRLTLGKVTNAVRGAPYTVRLSGLPTSGGLYAVSFGLSSVASATVGSLPASMSSLGAPGCFIYASPDVMYYRAGATSGTADVTNNVPANATLLGLIFYNQGYALDAGVNNLGFTSSNACAVRVL